MIEEYQQTLENWRKRVGTDRPFHEQELWKTRVPQGRHNHVGWCSMDKRLLIKRILIAALQAKVVDCAGPGMWRFTDA